MNPKPEAIPTEEDPRLFQIVQEYLKELESGQRPDRTAYENRFPELNEAMGPYLDALDLVHQAAPLLKDSSREHVSPGTEDVLAPESLGDFRIIREIGRGGMGVVYEAVQLSLGRKVALKVLPFAAALDARQLQRFKNEAQAAAHLRHPSIVPVYAVGVERGVHFYAMQLVEGQNLASLIQEMRSTGTELPPDQISSRGDPDRTGPYTFTPQRPLSPSAETISPMGAQLSTQRSERTLDYFRTVARLCAQAAEALDYAHGVGIVHRDIKPANLLVDHHGSIWITDFGLAQFQADTGLTQTGDLLGTLRYMSPEQAGGRRIHTDHRTDVYSLGATLYELLTLQPIFSGTDRQTLLNQILHDDPQPPRSVNRSIPADLETIVLKSINKTPAERYASAQDFAEDLNCFLKDKPIRARRPSLLEKVTKWARRHKAVVVSAVVALILSVAGLSAATIMTAHAYDRERQKAQEADEQRERAEDSFRQARQAVDQFTKIGEEELAGKPFLESTRRRLLTAALSYYQDFINQRRDDPTLQAELEASRAKVETILSELTTLMGVGQYALLHFGEIQDELKLNENQREQLGLMHEWWREGFRDFTRLPPNLGERRLLALARDQEEKVSKLLTPSQLARFKQIALQQQGPMAFSDPEVVQTLHLTSKQEKSVRELLYKVGGDMFKFGHNKGGRPGPPRWREDKGPPPRQGDGWREAQKTILSLLTPQQRKKWEEMVGKHVRFEVPQGPGRLPPAFNPRR